MDSRLLGNDGGKCGEFSQALRPVLVGSAVGVAYWRSAGACPPPGRGCKAKRRWIPVCTGMTEMFAAHCRKCGGNRRFPPPGRGCKAREDGFPFAHPRTSLCPLSHKSLSTLAQVSAHSRMILCPLSHKSLLALAQVAAHPRMSLCPLLHKSLPASKRSPLALL